MNIPFYSPYHSSQEAAYVTLCSAGSLASDSAYSSQALILLKDLLKQEQLLFTPTCSCALELCLSLLSLAPGDQVILPSYNFPSAANAVLQNGGVPVFCDIDAGTQNITLEEIVKHTTKKTKAVICVDYGGIACSYNEIRQFTQEKGLYLIEDGAQSLGSLYYNAPLGTQGDLSAFSFHHTKNIICGEGGLFFCRDTALFEQAQIYRMHGTNRQAFLDGLCDRYTWRQPGRSLPLSELSCAFLLSQLEEAAFITQARTEKLFTYLELLKPLEEKGLAHQMQIPDFSTPNGHLYYLKFRSHDLMEQARLYLCSKGVDARTHYIPLHASPMGLRLGFQPQDLPESLRTGETLLRLPLHTALSSSQQEEICGLLLDWGKQQ